MGSKFAPTLASTVKPLDAVIDPAQCGAKAFRLAEMIRLGYPVPEAVVISGQVLQQILEETPLGTFVSWQIARLSVDDPGAVADAAKAIEAEVHSIELSADLIDELDTATSSLFASGPVVVRSSACGEDSNEAAFAGQLDSFLNVDSPEKMIDALKRCWASYWSHRSLTYQLARNVRLEAMGVIVQRQVEARFSGVLFTRNVQHPGQDEMVIEYCRGLGDALVSGQICPQRLLIDGNRAVTREQDESAEPSDALSDTLIRRLANTGRSLEHDFDHPQDIEWCVDDSGQLCIVQCRPITTLADPPRTIVWSNANVNENFPEPISPLLYSIASVGYYHYFRNLGRAFGISAKRIDAMEYPLQNIIGTHAGRLYYNLSNIHAVLRAAPFGEFLAEAFNQFVGAESTARDPRSPRWSSLRRSRLFEIFELITIVRKGMGRFWQMQRRIATFESTVHEFASDSHPDRLKSLDWSALLSLWRRFFGIRSQWTDAAMADASSMISYRLTQRILAAEFTSEADEAIANRLLTGLCDIVSGLPTERLWDLSRLIRQHVSLAAALASDPPEQVWRRIETDETLSDVRRALQEFLDQWGFRCSGELMLTRSSYQEDPASLLPILATYVTRDGPSPSEHLHRQQQNRERETERVLGVLRTRRLMRFLPWPRKHRVARRLIRWTQRSVACRERARLKQALLYSRFRRLALTVGHAFAHRGLLYEADDIFHLTFDEVENIISGACMLPATAADLAKLRRAELDSLSGCMPPDRIELPVGDFWVPPLQSVTKRAESEQRRSLRGTAVCGGSIVGRAVVLTDPRQFAQVAEGDILVTRQTDPGWGPILFLVRGLVMERGGMLSHGAILAREYGIPTVVGIPSATECVASGDTIRVDGNRGFVEILES